MAGSERRYTEDEARAAVADAVLAVRELRDATARIVPERSRGRAEIIVACDEALAAVGDAVRGDAVGDDRRSLWRQALDSAKRAVERAGRFIVEVGRTAKEALAQAWEITVQAAEAVKRAVEQELKTQWQRAKTAVTAAAAVLAGLLTASAGVMFAGWIVLAAVAILYFSNKD